MKNSSIFVKIFIGVLIYLLNSCAHEEKPQGSAEYIEEINNWHAKRIENLKKENGWLNLVGLYWLNEGTNTFGSNKENNLVFPTNAPEYIGLFIKKDSIVTFISNQNTSIFSNGEKIDKIDMRSDIGGDPTILETGSLRWFLIKRGDKYGIRLRDLEAKLLTDFEGIDRYPTNDHWKIKGRFIPYETAEKIEIPTILGTIENELSPGKIEFDWEDKEYNISPIQAGNRLFIVFADLTSGDETYGAGRFLYIDAPDSNNNVVIDFNKAYNPPCAFTKYATCPLPPESNKLRIRITAGEKKFGDH